MSTKNFFLGMLLIVLVTFSIRFYHLGDTSFVADEFLDMNGSYGYAQTGLWQSWDFNYGKVATQNINEARDERAALYKWQVAQVFAYFAPTEEHARLISVLWGVLSSVAVVFATWFFTRSRKAALIAGALFTVAVSSIIFDRRLRMYAMFYPLYLLASTFIFAAIEKTYEGKNILLGWIQTYLGYHGGYGLLAGVFLGTAFLTHQLTGTLFFVIFFYLLIQAIRKIQKEHQWNTVYIRSLGVLLVFLGIMPFVAPGVANVFFHGFVWFDNHYSYWGHFWSDFEHPLLGLVMVLLGGFFLAEHHQKKEAIFLLLSAFVPLIMAIWFWRRNVGPQYIFMAQSFLIILSAMGVKEGVKWLGKNITGKWQSQIGKAGIILAFLLLPNYSYFFQEENTYHQPASGENTNYRKLFTVFNQEKNAFEVLVTRNFRNYYFAGAKIPVYDFGGELSESKLQKSELEKLQSEYKSGAVVLSKSDFDYISKEAETFLESDAFEKVSHSTIRGGSAMYRW